MLILTDPTAQNDLINTFLRRRLTIFRLKLFKLLTAGMPKQIAAIVPTTKKHIGPVCNKDNIELKEPFPPSNNARANRLFLWVPGMLYTFWLCFGEMVRLLWRRVPAADDSQKSQLGKAAKVEPIWQQ
ncbi:hypothetical protein niasHT_013037 [Heterodera trifolii]|uniref:Uncharacterized protein n=1 Tax=Heterodera trifolii TaxID=157864 RepID=A0ABD2L3L7_9BILA